MNSIFIFLLGILSATVLFTTPAEAGRLLNKARKQHSHSHGNHAGHNHGAGWRFEAGVSSRIELGSEKPAEETEEGAHEEEGHDHALALSEGHDHSHGGDSGSESSGGSAMPTFSIGAAYGLNSSFAITGEIEFATTEGLEDPRVGVENSVEVNGSFSWKSTATASAPLSKGSRESGLMTALAIGTGPSWQYKRWKFGVTGSYTHYLYKAPANSETAAARKASFALDDHDHEEDVHGEEVGHAEHEGTTTGGVSSSNAIPGGGSGADEHGDEHGHEHGEEEVAARNSNQIRSATTIGYSLTKRVGLGGDFAIARLALDDGTSTFTTETTLAKASYSRSGFTGEAGFGLKATAPAIAAPNLPFIGLRISYEYE